MRILLSDFCSLTLTGLVFLTFFTIFSTESFLAEAFEGVISVVRHTSTLVMARRGRTRGLSNEQHSLHKQCLETDF